jgi:hypothetical protein
LLAYPQKNGKEQNLQNEEATEEQTEQRKIRQINGVKE